MALLGIGLPVYNGERYLSHTLQCLRRQSFTDFDVLIADNASTDGTGRIARGVAEIDTRFRYTRHRHNIGAAANFNHVFRHTRGEFFAWVASDDSYDPAYLSTCLELLRSRPDAIGAFTSARVMDADHVIGEIIEEPIRWDHPDPAVRFGDLASFRHACLTGFAVLRRSVVQQTELIRPCYGGDRLFLAELALLGPMAMDQRPMYFNRQHEERTSVRTRRGDTSARFAGSRALTWHYAKVLWAMTGRVDLDPASRRRVRRALGTWVLENRVKFARSAARALYTTAGELARRHPRAHP